MTKHVWKPGESGNPSGLPGRPARTKLTELFSSDLHKSWEQFGGKVLEELAKKQPQAFAQLAARLIPTDVALTIQAQPGNLSPEDWHLMMAILEAVRQAIPDANEKRA